MKKNEGKADRWVRIVLGLVLLGFASSQASGVWVVVLSAVGVIAFLTGFFGWCPAYSLFGASTCPRE